MFKVECFFVGAVCMFSLKSCLLLNYRVPLHAIVLLCSHQPVCVCKRSFTHACVCAYAFVYVFACVWACVTYSISMEIKCGSSHKFTHSPCFDSIQSTVCIITLVPYGNLLGPKYCSLTNPSFVFSRYTKHQSCFSTHAAHQPPDSLSTLTHAHHTLHNTHYTNHAPPLFPRNTERYGTKSWLIRTARHAGIWVCH